jgi:hypothetical protein
VITQILWLLILAMPVGSISWTITHEEVLREPRDVCKQRSEAAKQFSHRKLFYLFTPELSSFSGTGPLRPLLQGLLYSANGA